METDDSNSESETTQGGGTQNDNNQQSTHSGKNQDDKEATLTTNFLEFGEPKNGEHTIALIKEQGEERSSVGARIYTEFPGDGKPPIYTAKDQDGNVLFAPTPKLWELKKEIKGQAGPLLEKARLAKNAPVIGKNQPGKEQNLAEKELKSIGTKIGSEVLEFGSEANKILTGTDRGSQLKSIRHKKVQRSKSLSR